MVTPVYITALRNTFRLQDETPCVPVDPKNSRLALDLPEDHPAKTLADHKPGDRVYVRSDDPSEDGDHEGCVMWWNSELVKPT